MSTAQRLNQIVQGDCVAGMQSQPESSVDLVFADPPFNIGYDYDVYDDRQEREKYLDWSRAWIAAVHRILKDTGTFWLAIGDEYAAELKLLSQEVGFHCRSWVIWYYTFGVNCKNKFTRSHAHLFYFVKDLKHFTFNGDDLENRIPSARQLVYADKRANPVGRLADDTWVLRPQDLVDCFTPGEDTWYLPRVAGTFKERAGFHGCQMPEQLLGRIVRLCSKERDVVLDPFSGSATTLAVAKKLGRQYLGFELSEEYVTRGSERLSAICPGDPLEGSAEPTVSAPQTPAAKGNGKSRGKKHSADNSAGVDAAQVRLFRNGLREAFRRSYDGFSVDRVIADRDLNAAFVQACQELDLPGEARTWNWNLLGFRKTGLFVDFAAVHRTGWGWDECDEYLFASEIAWRQMVNSGCESLDAILCDPELALEFDNVASSWAPGYSSLQYRWAALKLRKAAKVVRTRAAVLSTARLRHHVEAHGDGIDRLPNAAGVYLVCNATDDPLYAGVTSKLQDRIRAQLASPAITAWKEYSQIRYFSTTSSYATRLAHRWRLVHRHKPRLNLLDAKLT